MLELSNGPLPTPPQRSSLAVAEKYPAIMKVAQSLLSLADVVEFMGYALTLIGGLTLLLGLWGTSVVLAILVALLFGVFNFIATKFMAILMRFLGESVYMIIDIEGHFSRMSSK